MEPFQGCYGQNVPSEDKIVGIFEEEPADMLRRKRKKRLVAPVGAAKRFNLEPFALVN
jgi:hypothetical protein